MRKAMGVVGAVSTIGAIVFPPLAIAGLSGLGGTAVAVGGLLELGAGDSNDCLRIAANESTHDAVGGRPDEQEQTSGLLQKTTQGVKGYIKGAGKKLKAVFGN